MLFRVHRGEPREGFPSGTGLRHRWPPPTTPHQQSIKPLSGDVSQNRNDATRVSPRVFLCPPVASITKNPNPTTLDSPLNTHSPFAPAHNPKIHIANAVPRKRLHHGRATGSPR